MSFPSTVQAIAISKTGGVEVLEKLTVPFPKQEPGDIVVKVRFARFLIFEDGVGLISASQVNWGGVNSIDTYFRCARISAAVH